MNLSPFSERLHADPEMPLDDLVSVSSSNESLGMEDFGLLLEWVLCLGLVEHYSTSGSTMPRFIAA